MDQEAPHGGPPIPPLQPPSPPPLLLPQLPLQNPPPPYLFSSSSSSFSLPYPSSQLQLLPDIDWVSLFSGPTGVFGENFTRPGNITGIGSSGVPEINGQEEENGGVNSNNKRRSSSGGRTKKATRPRFAFQTRSPDDILDDGYRWRKYGQKAVKNSSYPRCTHHTCNVKKQIQRLSKDTGVVVTTYEGNHNHPCEKLMETLTPLLKQMQFLARF